MAVTGGRPSWLPEGHAFCPGDHEEVRTSLDVSGGKVGNSYKCDHGYWHDIDEAREAHSPVQVVIGGVTVLTPERLGREGDSQPLPVGTSEVDTQTIAMRLIEKRRELGIKRYGQPLQPSNGRDSLWDAVEESLDMYVYLLNYWRSINPGVPVPGLED